MGDAQMNVFNVWIANTGRETLLSEDYVKRRRSKEGQEKEGWKTIWPSTAFITTKMH